jgi:hypothetical protein
MIGTKIFLTHRHFSHAPGIAALRIFQPFGNCVVRIDNQYACLNLPVRGIGRRLFVSSGRSQTRKYAAERSQQDHHPFHQHGNALLSCKPVYLGAKMGGVSAKML